LTCGKLNHFQPGGQPLMADHRLKGHFSVEAWGGSLFLSGLPHSANRFRRILFPQRGKPQVKEGDVQVSHAKLAPGPEGRALRHGSDGPGGQVDGLCRAERRSQRCFHLSRNIGLLDAGGRLDLSLMHPGRMRGGFGWRGSRLPERLSGRWGHDGPPQYGSNRSPSWPPALHSCRLAMATKRTALDSGLPRLCPLQSGGPRSVVGTAYNPRIPRSILAPARGLCSVARW
jgi:hypothetical protein